MVQIVLIVTDNQHVMMIDFVFGLLIMKYVVLKEHVVQIVLYVIQQNVYHKVLVVMVYVLYLVLQVYVLVVHVIQIVKIVILVLLHNVIIQEHHQMDVHLLVVMKDVLQIQEIQQLIQQ